MRALCLVLVALLVRCESRATLEDNGYNDLVIAISPQVKEDQSIVDNIKHLFTEASRELYNATRKRAYFNRVKILLPKSWSNVPADPAIDETFETAEIVVDEANSAYGNNPYTIQVGECGEPGDKTHFTPWFINNHKDEAAKIFGKTEKVVVHEWARLRYGVFEEYGYPGDEKFPMFYYKTTWTMNGQENVLVPNLCTDTDLSGISVDVTTGGACRESQDTGLPDNNCFYQPFLNNTVRSSYMSIPYLDSVVTFCDESEDYIHNSELPTKHNLYCDGKSVWGVIMESPDFQNDANQPTEGLDTTPEFVVVQPKTSRYVLVMDVSTSMKPSGNTGNIPRNKNMLDAAKRWIKYEVADGTEIGLVVFSDETSSHPVMNTMVTVNDEHTRDSLLGVLDHDVKFGGQTCIGCGLNIALMASVTLNNTNGGVIILITDGKQKCRSPSSPNCLEISDVIDNLVEHKTRVVTIALGDEADPDLEDLAVRTGGKSYFIDDSSGAGNINDAFTGSLTYQPGDVITNTDTYVYQKDWKDVTKKIVGTFDIDNSIGRNTTFQLDVRTKENDNNCKEDLDVTLVDPSDDHKRTDLKFKCDAANFGVFKHDIPDLTVVGTWTYMIKPKENFTSISVKVLSKARSQSMEPVMTKCWIATGSQEIDTNVNVKLAVVAQVTQGNKPVLGASVEAQVERPPAGDTPQPAMQIELMDNGSGADKIKNDGMYSRYFAKYTGKGRYSVKCQVVGNEDTNINEGFTAAKHSRVYPPFHDPSNPLCCGSNALAPGANLTKTGNFTRHASGGSFQVTNDIDANEDHIPPGRVDDLVVLGYNNLTVSLQFTSPGDDLDSNDEPANYTIKFSTTSGNLTVDNFANTEFNTEIEEEELIDSSLSPQNGSTVIKLNIKVDLFKISTKYYFAMRATDHAENLSPVSNVAQLYISNFHMIDPSTTTSPTPEPSTPEPPTTEPPTPEPPTPEPPTPEPPTPEPPTTEPPTPEPPTPEPPTTEPPTPEPPTTEPPTPEPPTPEPPTSEPPTPEPPTTEPPTTEPTSEPSTPEPPTSEPTTPQPPTSEPTTHTTPSSSMKNSVSIKSPIIIAAMSYVFSRFML